MDSDEHIHQAERCLQKETEYQTLRAIAHALIALAERLANVEEDISSIEYHQRHGEGEPS